MDQWNTYARKKLRKRPTTFEYPSQRLPNHDPPFFNISQSEFKDLVQKLTGLPSAHNNNIIPTPNPPPPPKPSTMNTRLQLIRPPPLAHISNSPMQMLNSATEVLGYPTNADEPLSPLPPLPTVHADLESPVSCYMRNLRDSMMGNAAETEELQMASSSSFGCFGSSGQCFQQKQLPLRLNVQVPSLGGSDFI